MSKKIVFIEDDIEFVGPIITKGLQEAGYEVSYSNTLAGFREMLNTIQPDIVLLDLEIGNENSADEIPYIHSHYPSLPILIASSHAGGEEVERCLTSGAAYYVKKPYEIQEIIALIRRYCPDPSDIKAARMSIGNYQLDIQTHQLYAPDRTEIHLNPKEFKVLMVLMEHPEKVVSRTTLLLEIWNNSTAENSLNNCITHLRSYFKQDPNLNIKTVKKVGYKMILSDK